MFWVGEIGEVMQGTCPVAVKLRQGLPPKFRTSEFQGFRPLRIPRYCGRVQFAVYNVQLTLLIHSMLLNYTVRLSLPVYTSAPSMNDVPCLLSGPKPGFSPLVLVLSNPD